MATVRDTPAGETGLDTGRVPTPRTSPTPRTPRSTEAPAPVTRHPAGGPSGSSAASPAGSRAAAARPGALAWALALLLAPGAGLVVVVAADRLHLPHPSQAPQALTNLASAVLLAALAVLGASRWGARARLAPVGAALGVAALAAVLVAIPLQGTRWYLGGVTVDQSFRVQYLTRMASSPHLADMNYAHTAPYYPAGWFWVGGRLADLAGVPAWVAYKPYAIATLALVGALLTMAWTALAGRRRGLLVAVLTVVVGTRFGAVEPYSWCVAALVPVLAVVALRASRTGVRAGWRRLVGLGLWLGASGAVYTLYAGFEALLVTVLLASPAAVALVRRDGRAALLAARQAAARLLVVAPLAALVALSVWLPYAEAVVSGLLHGAAHQRADAPRYLPPGSADLPFPMLEPSLWGALFAVGAVSVVLLWRRSDVVRALAVVSVAVYGWFVASTLALAVHTTLLAFRMVDVLTAVLAAGAVLGAAEASRAVRAWWAGRPDLHLLGAGPHGQVELRLPGAPGLAVVTSARWRTGPVAAVVLAGLVVMGLAQAAAESNPVDLATAYTDAYPTGADPQGVRDRTSDAAWAPQLRAAISAGTGAAPASTVVLSTWSGLLSTTPYWGYQMSGPHYADPLGDFDARSTAIEGWARATSPADLLARLHRSPGRAPDALVLRRESDGDHLTLTRDVFPADPNVSGHDVVLAPSLFTAAAGWTTKDVGPFVVLTRRVG